MIDMGFKDLFIKGSYELCQQVPEPTMFIVILGSILVLFIFWFVIYYILVKCHGDP